MNIPLKYLLSTGLGAAAMYYFDPARGRYRRALVRDQFVHAGHVTNHGASVVTRDSRNRAVGLLATVRSVFTYSQPDDAVLVQRVRACLGRAVSHPHSITVEAKDGEITVSGPILEQEVRPLMQCALGVSGVKKLHNRLDVHSEPGSIPGLQGGPRQRPGQRSAFMQTNWSPTARAVAGLAGAIATYHGFGSRAPGGTLVGTGGLLLLTRAVTNLEMRRLLGIGDRRHAVDIQKSIRIEAPIGKVFKAWDNFETFPWFMRHVRQVQRIRTNEGKERWRWTVTGPTGTAFEFDSVVTSREPGRQISWRTEGESLVQNAGRVQFHDNGDDSTTIDIKMTYNPVVGAVGHAIACLFGTDPKHQMDDDLLRLKSYLETGKLPHDAAQHAMEMPRTVKEALEAQDTRGNGDGSAQQGTRGAHQQPPM